MRAVFPQHGYGGLERSASAHIKHLLHRGIDIVLFTQPLPSGRPFVIEAEGAHLAVRAPRYGRLPLRPNSIPARLTNYRLFVEEMGRMVRGMAYAGQIDGIYANGLCAWGVREARAWGVPMVANPHGMEEFKVQDPLKRLAYAPFRHWVREGCHTADRVVATDYAMRREVQRFLKVPASKLVVLPNGVDPAEGQAHVSPSVKSALSSRWPLLTEGEETFRGISVGRLETNKGFKFLLEALATSRATLGERWVWVLVGEGSQEAELESLAARLGLRHHLLITGAVSDAELHNLYAMSDLFVHPTLWEGSSLVTLEAMSHSLPVIASRVGGIPDKVLPGRTGFLVNPGDVSGLAEHIRWMVMHPTERREMGRLGARLAQDHFSWSTVAAQTEELFRVLRSEKSACLPAVIGTSLTSLC